uniref:Uncharacterized protein n=1 Tax=Cacopsylla melanoneura TaxID=428564 RepID=A0A8D8ZAM1_9HEMI
MNISGLTFELNFVKSVILAGLSWKEIRSDGRTSLDCQFFGSLGLIKKTLKIKMFYCSRMSWLVGMTIIKHVDSEIKLKCPNSQKKGLDTLASVCSQLNRQNTKVKELHLWGWYLDHPM